MIDLTVADETAGRTTAVLQPSTPHGAVAMLPPAIDWLPVVIL
jgi:hypothetical protein